MFTDTNTLSPMQSSINKLGLNEEKNAKIIRKYTIMTSVAALIPNDYLDVISSSICQTLMVKELCSSYQIPFSDRLMNVAFWSATGSVLIKGLSSVVEKVIDANKNKESIDLTAAAVAGIYTSSIGGFYNEHFKSGGTLEDMDLSDFGEYFVNEVKDGDLSMATFTNPNALLKYLNM